MMLFMLELPSTAEAAAELLMQKDVDPSSRAFHCANELQVISKNPVKILQGRVTAGKDGVAVVVVVIVVVVVVVIVVI